MHDIDDSMKDTLYRLWNGKTQVAVNVDDELKDLKKVYEHLLEDVEIKSNTSFQCLLDAMEQFLNVYKKKKEIEAKIKRLDSKMNNEDEEEDEYDE